MKSIKRNGMILAMSLLILLFCSTGVFAATPVAEEIGVQYRGHVQNKGDMPQPVGTMVKGPDALGTRGESLRVEGFWIELTGDVPEGAAIKYQVHVENEGWMTPEENGVFAGTHGKCQRVESIRISLENLPGYDVYYRGHVQNIGDVPQVNGDWGWKKNGEELGTTGSSLRLEELQVKVVKQPDVTYDKAGTYGPKTGEDVINNSVVINKPGVTLQNMHITGDLTIGEGVGEGDVTLNNVTVDGDTFIRGGGKNSIHINGGDYNKITVQQTSSGQVRIVATNAAGLEVVISENAKGESIILEGAFENVQVDAPDVKISTQGDTAIKQMNMGEAAKGSEVTLDAKTKVGNLVLDAEVDVKGQGTVEKAEVNSDGVTFEKAPVKQDVDPGVVTPPVVTPPVVTPPVVPTPTPGGGGAGGGTPSTTAITGVSITGDQNVGSTLTATTNPTGATGTYQWMRCATANGTYKQILGATSNTYVLQSADATRFIKVIITGNGSYTGTQTSVATSAITNLKEITAYTPLTSITLSSNENLTDLASLKASSKLPTQVTVTDGTTPVSATITNWTGTFDGTTTGAKTLTAVWTMPNGYRDQTSPITVSITVNVNTAQTAVQSSAKAITGTTIGTLDAGNITAVPVGTKVKALKDGLTLSPYATCEIMASSDPGALAVTDQENTNVTGTMVIKVTAQNNSTATFTIAMASVKSAVPTAGTVTVAKTSATQASVDFTLTSSHTGGTWKVYSDSACATLATGVTASLSGSTLTLSSSGTDVAAATYYIVWNDGTNADSNALALTVSAYEAPDPGSTVGVVSNPQWTIVSGSDPWLQFTEPNDLTGISSFDFMFSTDGGSTWENKKTVRNDEYYVASRLTTAMSVVSGTVNATTTYNKVKVISKPATGYTQAEAEFPLDFTITKTGSPLVISALRNASGNVEVKLPADKTSNQTYIYQILNADGSLIRSDLISVTAANWWSGNDTIVIPSVIVPSNDSLVKISLITDGTETSLNATPLQSTGASIVVTPTLSSAKAITDTTVGSLDANGNIIGVPIGTKVSALKTALTLSASATCEIMTSNAVDAQAVSSQDTTDVIDTMVVKVTAQDNSTATYTIAMASALSSAKAITDTTVGSLDANGNVTAVLAGTKVSALKTALTLSASATCEIMTSNTVDAQAVSSQDTTDVIDTMVVKVTAQDNSTATYTIAMASALSSAKAITDTTVGSLDANGNVTAVLAGTKVKALKDALTLSQYATGEIMASSAVDALAVTDQENTDVTGTMVIKVTAQDNSTTTYTITMASTLDVPTDLRAVAGNESIELHWSTVANAVSYKVYQSTTSGTGYSEVVNLQSSSSYQVLNLTPGQTYYFVVKAVATGYNDSPNSSEVSAIANVTPSGLEISGNQLIISNESTDLATQSTGTLSSIVTPPMNELNTEGMEGSIRINPEIPLRNSPDQGTLDASMLPTITSSQLSDVQDFYTYNYTTATYDTTTAHCAFIGTNVEVWIEDNASQVQLTDSEATTIGQEFDNNIYGLVTTNFYDASDVDHDGKITILCYDIKDGYTGSGGYVGGYYDPNNQFTGATSNQMDMIFVDTYPMIGSSKNLSNSYSTMAHELQHLVNYNCNQAQGGQMATWLNESLSQAAEQMYNGVQADRIAYFNNSTVIANGRSVMDWQQADSLPNYSLSYLFGQYLRTQAEQKLDAGVKTDIFKDILVDTGNETTALTNAIHNNIDPNLSLSKVLTNFRVATALKATTGVYGFGKDAATFFSISPKLSTLTSADLKGGGAIIKDISAGPFTVPTVHGNNVTYTGVY